MKSLKLPRKAVIKLVGNAKVAANRGKTWKSKLIKGKLDAITNSTLLRKIRVDKDINQKFVAGKVGMSTATYGSIERAKRPVSKERAEKIAKILGTNSLRLFTQLNKNKMLANFSTTK